MYLYLEGRCLTLGKISAFVLSSQMNYHKLQLTIYERNYFTGSFLLCKELEQDSSGKSSPMPCVEALIPRTLPFIFLKTMQYGLVSASMRSHLGCLFTDLSFGFFGVNSPCIGRKLLHGNCWCSL